MVPVLVRLAAVASLAVLLAACAGPGKAPGVSCQEASECVEGLDCLDPADTFVPQSQGCTGAIAAGLRFCSAVCTGDADCAAFGADVVCARNGCGDTGICLTQGDAQAAAGKP